MPLNCAASGAALAPSPDVTGTAGFQAFLVLRYTLIAATGYLLVVEQGFVAPPPVTMALLAIALVSNLALGRVPPRLLETPRTTLAVILFDTAWISAALVLSHQFSAEFFYLYFFVVLLAAIGENLRLIAIAAVVVCGAYLFGHSASGGTWSFWQSPSLIRIPFLFTAAVFYGYLVERTRRERQRADDSERHSSELAAAMRELRVLYAKTEHADSIKAKFFASVSHEVRTPLSVLLGYVDLLLDGCFGTLSEEQSDVLTRTRRAGRSLHDLIVRMLDVSHLESARETPACEEFELALFMQELRTTVAHTEGITVQWPQVPEIPPLRTDPEKLRTVLRNLVENAVKFTPRGWVIVDARWDDAADDVLITVTDTGPGIPETELPHIFEAFRNGGNPDRRPGAGVGLGLYVAKRLTALLGGEISVTSIVGTGSRFTVRFPRLLYRGAAVPDAAGVALRADDFEAA